MVSHVIIFNKTIGIFDVNSRFTVRIGGFTNNMQSINIDIYRGSISGGVYSYFTSYSNVGENWYYSGYIPEEAFGQRFYIRAYSNDINKGTFAIQIA